MCWRLPLPPCRSWLGPPASRPIRFSGRCGSASSSAPPTAAIAGVYDRSAGSGATTNTPSAVCHDIALNLHTWMALQGTSPCTGSGGSYSSISYPGNTAFVINQVSVTLRVQQSLPFSSMFVSAAPVITASSTAGSVSAGGTACVQALEPSSSVTDSATTATRPSMRRIASSIRIRPRPTRRVPEAVRA